VGRCELVYSASLEFPQEVGSGGVSKRLFDSGVRSGGGYTHCLVSYLPR